MTQRIIEPGDGEFLREAAQEWGRLAGALDTDPGHFTAWMDEVKGFTARYLETLGDCPAFQAGEKPDWLREALPEGPGSLGDALLAFEQGVVTSGINTASGRFLGYIPGGGVPTAALGDYLAALTNKYAGAYTAAPGAVEIENQIVRWLMKLVGFPDSGWGTLQSGGSLATLTALVAARSTRPWQAWEGSPIYLSEESHHCIEKALFLAGLERVPRRRIPVDDAFRLRVDVLESWLKTDREAGLEPWILVATAGTTNTGAIDPLERLLEIARAEGLWLHVDAAYGGFFVQTARGRGRLQSMAEADSLVLDPHKGLFMPYGLGAVLVRERKRLYLGGEEAPAYLADAVAPDEPSPLDYSPELTRHFRGLRLWLSLKIHGFARFQAALEEKLVLARIAHHELSSIPELEVGPEPELSCLVFRARAGEGATRALLDDVLKSGLVYLNSTRLGGELFLRLCVLSFRTHLPEIELVVREIRRAISSP